MKKQLNLAFALIITALVLAGSQFAAAAQTAQRLDFEVPFEFVAGDRRLPAGRYTVRRVKVDSEAALRIEDAQGRVRATVLTNAAAAPARRAALTFKRYGGRHFLAGVWMPGAPTGRELQESKQERELRAEAGCAARTIAVVARQR